MPRFSIVVPAYNAQATLPETLEAVLEQTFDDWECVVVDDGSMDRTFAVAQEYEVADPRIRVLSQANRGTGGAYNTGVRYATGDWISVCSADDVLLSNHLHVMDAVICANPSIHIITCNGYFWDPNGTRTRVYGDDDTAASRSWSLEDLLDQCFFSVGACYRRELFDLVDGYRENAFGEDYDFWLRSMARGAAHLYIPVALALHRRTASQKSANLRHAYESDIDTISRLLNGGGLTPEQTRAARVAITRRKRLLLEQTAVGRALFGASRKLRSTIGRRQ